MDQDTNENKKTLLALLILIILLTLLSLAVWWFKKPHSEVKLKEDRTAPVGTVVESLSKSYILDKNAEVIASRQFSLSSGEEVSSAKASTATYKSSLSFSDLFSSYVNYLNVNGYKIRSSEATPTMAMITAYKGSESFSVVIQSETSAGDIRIVSVTSTK